MLTLNKVTLSLDNKAPGALINLMTRRGGTSENEMQIRTRGSAGISLIAYGFSRAAVIYPV